MEFHKKLIEKLLNDVEQERSSLNKLKEYWTYFAQNQGVQIEDKNELLRCNVMQKFKEKADKMIDKMEF
jgi:hypothetical protein